MKSVGNRHASSTVCGSNLLQSFRSLYGNPCKAHTVCVLMQVLLSLGQANLVLMLLLAGAKQGKETVRPNRFRRQPTQLNIVILVIPGHKKQLAAVFIV